MQAKGANIRWSFGLWWALANIVGYAVAGAVFGLMQWRGLRRQIALACWWVLDYVVARAMDSGK